MTGSHLSPSLFYFDAGMCPGRSPFSLVSHLCTWVFKNLLPEFQPAASLASSPVLDTPSTSKNPGPGSPHACTVCSVLSPRPRLYVGRLLPVPCEAPSAAGCPCPRLPHTCRGLTSTGLPPCLLLNSKEIPGDLRGRSWWGRGDASSTPAPGVRSLSWSQGSPGSDRQ